MTDDCYAAIDLGTNSCRLLICNKDGNEVCKETVATKLGEGLYKSGLFTPQAIERGVKCFFEYRQLIDKYNVKKIRAVATASCRMAANSDEFIKKVWDEARIQIEVIDGFEEARLNLKGALSHVCGKTKYVVLYDLGGGSTEITLATNTENPHILHTISIPWGARNASEAFNLVEYNEENANRLRQDIGARTESFVKKSYLETYLDDVCFVATSSTPLRLASMIEDFGVYDRDRADGVVMDREALDKAIDSVLRSSRADMADNPYIGDKRSYIFIAAAIIFQTIYERLGVDKITASLKSAKDGIVAELIEKDHKNEKAI
ncbi:MAG: hypothetical protein IKA03_06150 [Alphaproteobacteria bacterium]|nr:hypothetical protein [Alphaproteobacteria bacterium]